MRVLVVSNGLPPVATGGAEAHAYDTSVALAQRHEVRVLSGTATYGHAPFALELLPPLPPLRPDAPVHRKAVWHLRDQWRPDIARRVAAEVHSWQPDVALTHNVQGLSAAVFTALGRTHARHVHFAHDLNLVCLRASMTKDLRPCSGREFDCLLQRRIRAGAIGRRLDLLVAPSEFVRRRHVQLGVVAEAQAVALRHGTRLARARVRERGDGPLRVGFIGSLTDYKGVPTLLRALAESSDGWRLAIAGVGPLQSAVEEAAAADPRIVYAGPVSGARKDAFLDELDVLIVPSEWEENAPLVVIEAAVRGLPSIVSDRGGLPENEGARVFRAGDSAALRQAIGWFDADRGRLARCSRALIAERDRYSWERHVEQLEAFLGDVAKLD